MSRKWMLDTDVCIHTINQNHTHKHIVGRLDGLEYGQIVISAITCAELQYGIARSRLRRENMDALLLFIQQFHIASFDSSAAEAYGPLRHALQAAGQTIGPLDMLIAAHALSTDCCLVTHNVREFARVEGLIVEDWITDSQKS